MDLRYDINILTYAAKLRKHLNFVKKRYGLPNVRDELDLTGVLVGDILKRGTLKSDSDVSNLFLYLLMNTYCLGTKIAIEFFVDVFDDAPSESESGIKRWRGLVDIVESYADRKLTYYDIIARRPLVVQSAYVRSNLDRVVSRNQCKHW